MIFNMLAIWAMATKQKETSYVGQVYQGIQLYEGFLTEREAVVVGDLNSNTQWDAQRCIGNHSIDDMLREAIARLVLYQKPIPFGMRLPSFEMVSVITLF